ncbi:MAG: FAD-binding oxidoreductase [bacterium]|nr:FAD-binding oxidoreductase [bacterium]
MELFKTTLIDKRQLAPDIWQFRFQLDNPSELNFTPGQYLILMIGEQRRLYSIASSDSLKDNFSLIVKLLPDGVGSNFLRSLEIDGRAFFQGPAGFFTLRSQDKPKVFLAAGAGIAPIRSQIFSLLEKEGGHLPELLLFWGLKRKEDVYFFDEFNELSEKCSNFNFWICLDQEENFLGLDVDRFRRGRVDQAFQGFVKEKRIKTDQLNDFEYYLCGAREIVESLNQFLQDLGVKKENIFFDKF